MLLPKFGFYEGHLNAYNRDYWKEADKGRTMTFEDGKSYKESASDKTASRSRSMARRTTISSRPELLSTAT